MVIQTIKVGKKYAVYLPKKVVENLQIEEGDSLVLQTRENGILLKPVKKIEIVKPWSKIKPEEVERVGEEITRKLLE